MANIFITCGVLLFVHFSTFVTSQDAEATSSDEIIEEVMVPMCKNMVPYNMTKLPNVFGHRTQLEVYRAIENYWAFMDYGCSNNFRLLVCSLYLPKYDPESQEVIGPCKNTCLRAKRGCSRVMRNAWSRWPRDSRFKCKNLPNRHCLRGLPERRGDPDYPYCIENPLPLCQQLPYAHGYLPNFYHQYDVAQIESEMLYYNDLVESRCSNDLKFFLCGTMMPFCAREQFQWFKVPCKELCERVQTDCSADYQRLYPTMPWPNKLQCHRYPTSTSGRPCAMPGDEEGTVDVVNPQPDGAEIV